MTALGKAFGLSHLQAARAGLLLAAGGEFAFVTFGEAVQHKILPAALVSKLFLVVALSMALTPFLAEGGAKLGKVFEKSDMKVRWAACRVLVVSDIIPAQGSAIVSVPDSVPLHYLALNAPFAALLQALQPNENLHDEVRDHVIIAGFGRVGQIIGQLLSERLIPFVALDVQSDRVQVGRFHSRCSIQLSCCDLAALPSCSDLIAWPQTQAGYPEENAGQQCKTMQLGVRELLMQWGCYVLCWTCRQKELDPLLYIGRVFLMHASHHPPPTTLCA